jgi:peptidoglycan/LPS O-acetylase OafA/YrhL
MARLGERASLLLAAFLTVASALLTRFTGESNWCLTLHYGALFVLGSLLLRKLDSISRWYAALDRIGRGSFVLSAALLVVYGGRLRGPAPATEYLADWTVALGVLGLMILGLNAPRVRAFLTMPALERLGRISYSLYLVHLTVLLSLVNVLGISTPPLLLFAMYVTLAFGVAVVFHRLVEAPAQRTGAYLSERRRPALNEAG